MRRTRGDAFVCSTTDNQKRFARYSPYLVVGSSGCNARLLAHRSETPYGKRAKEHYGNVGRSRLLRRRRLLCICFRGAGEQSRSAEVFGAGPEPIGRPAPLQFVDIDKKRRIASKGCQNFKR